MLILGLLFIGMPIAFVISALIKATFQLTNESATTIWLMILFAWVGGVLIYCS